MRKIRPGTFFWVLVPALLLLTIPLFADSHVRIVRLSDVEGNVQVDRNIGQGFENALLNLPITEGVKLRTQGDGRAEIEFENGSTLRIAPFTEIHFDQLSLRDSGKRNSSVTLVSGILYVNCSAANGDEFTLNFGHQTVKLDEPAHFRLGMDGQEAALSVFSGEVQIQNPSGEVLVRKNQTGDFNLTKQDQYQLVKNIEPNVFDDWDKSQLKYHDRYMANASYKSSSPYAYGISDLNYYGTYVNVPGYGMMWQPRLASADWNPFVCGRWVLYPSVGNVWVSCYPWGWMPFYYGSWNYEAAFGWFWNPKGTWQSWNYAPVVTSSPPRFILPRPPARPVKGGGGGNPIVVVNRHPMPLPGFRGKIVLRSDSAGLGVPRGGIRNWNKVTAQVQRNGEATTTIRATSVPVFIGSEGFRPAVANRTTPQNPGLAAYRSTNNRGSASPSFSETGGSRSTGTATGRSASSMPSSSMPSRSMPSPSMSSPSMSSSRGSAVAASAPARH